MWKAIASNAFTVLGSSSRRSIAIGYNVTTAVRSKITVTKTTGEAAPPAPAPTPTLAPPKPPAPEAETIGFSISTRKALQLPDLEKEIVVRQLQEEVKVHHKHANYKDALKASLALLDASVELFGKDHPVTASAYNNIGLMHKSIGNWDESRKMYHESLRIYGRVVGKDHASYAAALHNIGALNKTQVHMDESLTAIRRLQLNEEAVQYLQDAWRIRQVELGDEHPHTIASRSYYGSTLAAQLIQSANNSKKSAVSPSRLTKQGWAAAEDHLRQALKLATDNPRGALAENTKRIQTLSAAAAAQNLAVFLKTRGTDIQDDGTAKVLDEDALAEAKQLYEHALEVRTALLHKAHPDIVATKFSLAELLAAVGDEDGANALREEIVEVYDVEERDERDEDESEQSDKKDK